MNKEIKEILDKLLKYFKESNINDFGYEQDKLISYEEAQILLDYITNLQRENERLQTQLNAYENPDDMTLFYMWLDEKAKDKMKELQEENERLKQFYYKKGVYSLEYDKETLTTMITELQERIDKAIKCIEDIWKDTKNRNIYSIIGIGLLRINILNILQGKDKE